jgi:hypothetical protein
MKAVPPASTRIRLRRRPDEGGQAACRASAGFPLVSWMDRLYRQIAGPALVTALFLPGLAFATVSEFIRSQTSVQGRAIIDAARAMPAERYGYAPDSDQMSFGALVLHVAVGNFLFCSRIGSTAEPALAQLAADGPKDALVKRLQDSFDFCTRALASLKDAKMAEVLDIGTIKTPRSMAILTLSSSWNMHLSMVRDYLSQNAQALPTLAS